MGCCSGWNPASASESFVDTFTAGLIRDRVWCARIQRELATVEYVAWFTFAACGLSKRDIMRCLERYVAREISTALTRTTTTT